MRWLITGASGTLGAYLRRELNGQSVVAWSGAERGPGLTPVDLSDPSTVATAFKAANPDVVIHAAAMARVDVCCREPERARRINTAATEQLCKLAGNRRILYVSTDLVFDGESAPYRESDRPSPLSVYGRSKASAEPAVVACPRGLVVRASLMFGPNRTGRIGFFDSLVAALHAGTPVTLFADEWRTMLALSSAAKALVELARSDATGIMHVGGPERMSRLEMGRRLARYLGVSDAFLIAGRRNETAASEPRPRDVSLDSCLFRSLFPKFGWPSFEAALDDMLTG